MADRNPSKQRRAAQNKASREAIAQRRAKAAGQRETPALGSGREGRPSRTAKPAPVRSTPTNPIMRYLAEVQAVPGGKGVFFAFLFSVVAGGMVLFTRVTPREVMIIPSAIAGKALGLKPDEIEPVISADYALNVLGPVAILLALTPIAISGAAMYLAPRGQQRRNFTMAAFAMGIVVFLSGALGIYYMFAFGGLVFGAYKARQADPMPARQRRTKKSADDDEVDEEA